MVADALLRRDVVPKQEILSCSAVVTVLPEWIHDVKNSYLGDNVSQKIMEEVQQGTRQGVITLLQMDS